MKVRRMEASDLEQIARIEETCFQRPWSEESLYRDYAQNKNSRFYVAETDSSIVGHLGLWKRADHVHVTTLGVLPEHRRQGIGSELIDRVRQEFPDLDITLEVRVSNVAAQRFYQSRGFEIVGKRPSYYSDNNEDALVMSHGASARSEVPRNDAR